MYLVRGSCDNPVIDRAIFEHLPTLAEQTHRRILRVWMPPKHIAFGRRDRINDGFEKACDVANECGYPPLIRSVGGTAVAYTGTMVAMGYVIPVEQSCRRQLNAISTHYREATAMIKQALEKTGATLFNGEPSSSFCPGSYSLCHTGKIVGVAQRVLRNVTIVGACIVVSEADSQELGQILNRIYAALDMSFNPSTVGSIENAGGPSDPTTIIQELWNRYGSEHQTETIDSSLILERYNDANDYSDLTSSDLQ